jgi:GT2 family glycosyltransferase
MSLLHQPKICVIFATQGRPEILADVFSTLAHQTLQPSSVIISSTSEKDVGELAHRAGIIFVTGELGLTRQRNEALRHTPDDTEIVVFFDDDFVPHRRWLEAVAETFETRPHVAAITGHLIADGVAGAGLSFEESLQLIERFEGPELAWIKESESPYGCNMAFRCQSIKNLTFDERLVLVGWLEDRDFGAQVARRGGQLVKVGSALGVHRGVKKARVSDRCLGYAQVVNPFYLRKKGTMTTRQLTNHLFKHMTSNLFRSIAPEPHVDRFSRLCGNIIGLIDVMRDRVNPERATQL